MTAPSAARMPRLLALVPYLLARPGIKIADAARDFDVSAKQLRKDLELLWMCGLPGYGPGDLIDLSFDDDSVTVTFDAGMRRPLRLTGGEANALVIALRALEETPGVIDSEAVRRAIDKIESAAGEARPAGVVVDGGMRDEETAAHARSLVQRALTEGRALRMRYYTASKDAVTERTVDPMRLLIVQARSYLEAWCRRAEGVRMFRLDRIDSAEVLEEPAAPPEGAEPVDVSDGVFTPGPEQREAQLALSPDARWAAEYYPCTEVAELAGGWLRIRLRFGDDSWLLRLVLGLGGDAIIEHPAELAEQASRRASAALQRACRLAEQRARE